MSDVASAALFEWVLTAYGRYPLAALSAFFDESEQPGCGFGVAGILFRSKASLERLNRRWRKLLKCYEISAFHMVDAVTGNREFQDWPQAKRDRAIEQFVEVLTDNVTGSFVCIVADSAEADDVIGGVQDGKSLLGSRYAIALLHCIQYIAHSGRKAKAKDRISYLYENGAPNKGTAHVLLDVIQTNKTLKEKFKLYNHAHGEKKCHPALQAADIVAYQATQSYRDNPQSEEEEPPALRALRNIPYDGERIEERARLMIRYMELRYIFGQAKALERLDRRALGGKRKQQEQQRIDKEYRKFTGLVRKVLAVPVETVREREKVYQEQAKKNPNRPGPKPKRASGRASRDKGAS